MFLKFKLGCMTERLILETTGEPSLELVFHKKEDRWLHQWMASAPEQADESILTSVEGTPDQIWPPSPPLQEISKHELESGGAILGVCLLYTSDAADE